MSDRRKTLIVVLGPTASGKTATSIALAGFFKTEIISADSRQFYREIPIGTAAPSPAQRHAVPHHFVGHLSLKEPYNVSRFERDVLALLTQKFRKYDHMIMAGGSGLYIDAVCRGIDDLPDPDKALRRHLDAQWKEKGIAFLQERLKELDPEYFAVVDRQNPKRLLRAIEVCLQTGKKYSALRRNRPQPRDFEVLKIGLNLPREELFERINRRVEIMLSEGWEQEARRVYPFRNNNALNTVGYKELFAFFDGKMTREEAVEKIKTNTRRYAKRQLTWFKRDKTIRWFQPGETAQMIDYIQFRTNTSAASAGQDLSF